MMLFPLCFISYTSVLLTSAVGTEWFTNVSIGLMSSMQDPALYQLTANESIRNLKLSGIVPQHLHFKFYQYTACDDLSAVNSSIKLWFDNDVSIIVGPECSAGMVTAGLLATSLNRPIVGFLSTTGDLSNPVKYSTLIRVSFTMAYMAQAIRSVLQYYNWTTLAVVKHIEDCDTPLSGIATEFHQANIEVKTFLADFKSPSSLGNALKILKMTARIVLICGGFSPADALPFLQSASDADMMTNEYVYITPYYIRRSSSSWEPWLASNATDVSAFDSWKLYRNTILIQTVDENKKLSRDLSQRLSQFVSSNPGLFRTGQFNSASMFQLSAFYDALYYYGIILNKSVEFGFDARKGHEVVKASANLEFTGITGKILLDDSGDRISNYHALKLSSYGSFSSFLLMGPNNSFSIEVLQKLSTPIWNTIDNVPPLDTPPCGFVGDLCSRKGVSIYIIAISTAISVLVVVMLLIVLMFIYRKRVYERNLLKSAWKIDVTELKTFSGRHSRSSFGSTNRLQHNEADNNSSCGQSYFSKKGSENFAFYKDTLVAVKRWKRLGTVDLNREHLIRLKYIKEMNHENINQFVGFSTDAEHFVLSLWLFCPKRSLQEVLFNEDIQLDAMFQVAILRDIISGLDYIHNSPILFHGTLFVSNCVIDGRWITKLTDFGLHEIIDHLAQEKIITTQQEQPVHKLLCTAPEYLRYSTLKNLKLVDVYQYGMIMYQVVYRREPFVDYDLTSAEIIEQLKIVSENGTPLRPKVKEVTELDSRIQNLMQVCWQENTLLRPSVAEVKKQLFVCTQHFGKNLMDHMLAMLERYATNLERTVDERTAQLSEERKRADTLLYQMLPKSVADALKRGDGVPPEIFSSVTIYFSDIVGFTSICSRSKPMEVVHMLNSFYSKFDEIILKFEAYKVETVGDAYLVVSGLPVRNGDRHVTNIADMSLEILEVLKHYCIPHFPQEYLQIRIGMHSGPVAGGVVGLTMPKYCLFGDTVNFASRMESTGKAGKIHMTEDTKILLDKFKNYLVIKRGEIEIKGKGLCTTYWLHGKMLKL